MGKSLLEYTLERLRRNIEVATNKENKFDFIIFIEGRRGLGKSTLAYKILSGLKTELTFKPQRDIVYSREDTLKHLASKINGVIFSDEMIAVAYKRDFYNEDQKDLLKAFDMYRDSRNVFIGCIPSFIDLDKKIQKVCKLRIVVEARGFAVLHFPLRRVCTNDVWDLKQNERIEASWGDGKPKYSQMSTARAFLHFNDLTPGQREEYDRIKQEKRNQMFSQYNNGQVMLNEEQQWISKLIEKMKEGKVDRERFKLICELRGQDPTQVRIKINKFQNEHVKPEETRVTFKGLLNKEVIESGKTDI